MRRYRGQRALLIQLLAQHPDVIRTTRVEGEEAMAAWFGAVFDGGGSGAGGDELAAAVVAVREGR